MTVWDKIDISLRYYLHIDPDTLDDKEYMRIYQALQWIRKEEASKNLPNL